MNDKGRETQKDYTKQHASLSEQVQILRERGLQIDDEKEAEHYLSIVGYYRFSSYCFQFELSPVDGRRTHRFQDGVSFKDVARVYEFDKKLRLLTLEILERYETCVRSVWAHGLSELYGSHPHMNAEYFTNTEEYFSSFVALIQEYNRAKEDLEEVRHYSSKYTRPFLPPVWIIVSLMSFGELFRWVKNTKNSKVKNGIAKKLGMPNIQTFDGIYRVLTTVRNLCAHHGRLWDKKFKTRLPLISKNLLIPMQSVQARDESLQADPRIYNCLLILGHIALRLDRNSDWPHRVATLVKTTTKDEQKIMGFPEGWAEEDFWK